MKEKQRGLGALKADYEALRKKYKLPDFRVMNENFEIEVLAEGESEVLLRRIRKVISDRIASLLRILEVLLNPTNAPVFLFNIIKSFDEEDKKVIEKLYKKLNEAEIDIFSLDIEYDEKKEAEFLTNFMGIWREVQKDLKVLEKALKKSSFKETKKQEKSYFG